MTVIGALCYHVLELRMQETIIFTVKIIILELISSYDENCFEMSVEIIVMSLNSDVKIYHYIRTFSHSNTTGTGNDSVAAHFEHVYFVLL